MKPKKSLEQHSSSISTAPSPQKIQDLLELYETSQLVAAEKLAGELTQRYPDHGFGWQVLGTVLIVQGKSESAIIPLENATRLLPQESPVWCNLGQALMTLNRLDGAEKCLRQALAIEPELVAALHNLGCVLLRKGEMVEAENCFRQAIALNANDAQLFVNLGNLENKQGRTREAEISYRQALALNPLLPGVLNQLAILMVAKGERLLALDFILRSLQIEESEATKKHFVSIISPLRFAKIDPRVRPIMVKALTEWWGVAILPTATHFLQHTPGISQSIDRALQAWPTRLPGQDLFGADGFAAVISDPLLHALLVAAPIYGVPLERFLTMTRYIMLEVALQSDLLAPSDLEQVLCFTCALAQQCFVNEYLYVCTDEEKKQATALKDGLVALLATGRDIPLLKLIAVAMYFPLYSLPETEPLLDINGFSCVDAVLAQQVRNPLTERRLCQSIPCLTTINEGVSQTVRSMYEENPYPRWVNASLPAPLSLDQFTHSTFPLASPRPLGKTNAETEILVAGCGTGHHSIQVAARFQGARVLAIDLSLASLAYAMRKSLEMGFSGIEYAQADILKLGEIHRRFDLIESGGVLHHLADPWAGWKVLLSLLRPGGLMKLGFYSKIARREVTRVRAIIAEQGYGSTSEDIRRCRQDLIDLDKSDNLGMAVNVIDFFSTSACRDLLFHVQEHCLTLTDIAPFLQEQCLDFLGFEIDKVVLDSYRQRFPEDQAAINLTNWDLFEQENPDIFVSMYRFWVQKR